MSNNAQKNSKKQENAQQDDDSPKENGRLHPGIVTAIITTLGGLFVALVTVTPTLLRDFREQKYISQTQTAQVVNTTQMAAVVLPPTSAPTSIIVQTISTPEQNTTMQFVAPTEDQLGAFPYLTINYMDINQPDTVNYKFTANREESYLWTYFWCAKGENTLLQNLSVMNFSFLMDEVEIPQSKFYIYKSDVNKPWNCQIWTTMLADWGDTSSTTLTVTYLISESVSDGEKTYRPGAYRQELLLTIQ